MREQENYGVLYEVDSLPMPLAEKLGRAEMSVAKIIWGWGVVLIGLVIAVALAYFGGAALGGTIMKMGVVLIKEGFKALWENIKNLFQGTKSMMNTNKEEGAKENEE